MSAHSITARPQGRQALTQKERSALSDREMARAAAYLQVVTIAGARKIGGFPLVPSVQVTGASVEVGYSRWTGLCRESHAEVALSPSLPWSIALSGGVSNLRAEFASVRLAEFSVHGGVRDALLELGEPSGRVPIHVHGGVDRLTLVRPHGSAIAVRVSGGATEVHLDETFLESVGGGLAWRAEGHPRGLFELHISGGVTRLVLATLAPRGIPERSPGDMLALGLPQ